MNNLYNRTVSEDIFIKLQDRFTDILKEEINVLDKNILPILKKINGHNLGIVTIWSCESHPEKNGKDDLLYIMFAALNRKGIENITTIFDTLSNKCFEIDSLLFDKNKMFSMLHSELSMDYGLFLGSLPFINRWSINISGITSLELKLIMLKELEEIVDKLINKDIN